MPTSSSIVDVQGSVGREDAAALDGEKSIRHRRIEIYAKDNYIAWEEGSLYAPGVDVRSVTGRSVVTATDRPAVLAG